MHHVACFLHPWAAGASSHALYPSSPTCERRRRRPRCLPHMHFIDPAHTLPEFFGHVAAACGVGLAGILGNLATEDARESLARSRRRQRRLSRGARLLRHGAPERNWNDVEDVLYIRSRPSQQQQLEGSNSPSRIRHKLPRRVVDSDKETDLVEPEWFQDPALLAFDRKLGSRPPPAASEFYENHEDSDRRAS